MHRQRLIRHGHLEPTRPNDWGDREKHPLYATWVGHKRYKNKHSLCKEWHNDFWVFASCIKERPSTDHYLRPIDVELPVGVNNWHWVQSVSKNLTTEDQKAYLRQWAREDRKRNPEKHKDKSLKRQYGIGLNEFNQMLKDQNSKCAICNEEETAIDPKSKKPRNLAVDHCHSTGKIRGLLCSKCNTALGALKDSTELLRKAILYLQRTTTEP